jgi:phosphatidylcholine synthase
LALIASIERNLPLVFFYLALALFIDGVDGSLARRVDVKKYTPNINGENLDNIIDYLNYVFLPAFVIYWLDLVPEGMALISVATILIVSCYTFANNSIKTSDLYFSGFPALWNVVILYFYILDTDPFTNLLVIFALSFLTFIPLKYVHPFRVKQFRKSTLSILMLWMITTVLLLYFNYLDETVLRIAFLFWSLTNVYFILLTILRSLKK